MMENGERRAGKRDVRLGTNASPQRDSPSGAIGPVHSSSLSLRALDGDISKSHVAWKPRSNMSSTKILQMSHQERATLLSLLTFVECTEAIESALCRKSDHYEDRRSLRLSDPRGGRR